MNSVTNKDLQVIRKLGSIDFEYTRRGILSRLGFDYDEETGYSRSYNVSIRYDKINRYYEVMINDEEHHILVDGLISIARERYHDIKESSKVENNHIQTICEKVKVAS